MKKTIQNLKDLIGQSAPPCFFNQKAENSQIRSFERKLNIRLPDSYKLFLESFNGGFISLIKTAENRDVETLAWNSNYFLPLDEMEDAFERIQHKTCGKDYCFIPFLHTFTGEYLGFMQPLEGDESKVYDLWHESPASEWTDSEVYDSFQELLRDYIDKKGNIKTM